MEEEKFDFKNASSEELLQIDKDLKKFIEFLNAEDKKLKELEEKKLE
jgi:hypothetical protein